MQLTALDRRYEERTHVFTEFQDFAGATYRDAEGARDIHSLDYPYAGIVLEVVDANEGSSRDDLDDWLRDEYLVGVQAVPGSDVAQSLRFTCRHTEARAGQGRGESVSAVLATQRGFAIPGAERRVTIIHFLDHDPRAAWERQFTSHGDTVEASGLGRLELCAPFIPVLHGTDRYVDELR
jgi:hypothetical protein